MTEAEEIQYLRAEVARLTRMLDYSVAQEAKRACEVSEHFAEVLRLNHALHGHEPGWQGEFTP